MQTTQVKSICELCNREFDRPVGLNIHQRTCKIKAAEKDKDAQYERELADREKERRDAALAARMQPRRARAWEDPKLRGKPPVKTLAAKTDSAVPAGGSESLLAATKQADSCAIDSEPQPVAGFNTIDNIRTEYHPNSGRGVKVETFEDYREHSLKPAPVPEITDPWRPFRSRTDFEFAQLALDAALTKTHVDKLIKLVEGCIKGQDSFNLTNHQELYKTWDAASAMLTPVPANTTTPPCYI